MLTRRLVKHTRMLQRIQMGPRRPVLGSTGQHHCSNRCSLGRSALVQHRSRLHHCCCCCHCHQHPMLALHHRSGTWDSRSVSQIRECLRSCDLGREQQHLGRCPVQKAAVALVSPQHFGNTSTRLRKRPREQQPTRRQSHRRVVQMRRRRLSGLRW